MGKRGDDTRPVVQEDPEKVGTPGPTNPNCLACGRWKSAHSAFMPPTVPPKAKAAFVGEGPGQNEDRLGKQFVGPAGHVLNGCMERAGWRREEVEFHNAVRCNATKPTAHQIKCCRPFLLQDLQRSKPGVILALGATAGASLQGDNRCTVKRDRNRDLAIPGISYCPTKVTLTYHPASILHGNEENRDYIADDLAFLRRTAPTEGTTAVEITGLRELDRIVAEYAEADAFSVDLEWSTETGAILIVSICKKKGLAHWWCVGHKESEWTWADMKPRLEKLLDGRAAKIGHNIPGDMIQLARHGVELAGRIVDTLVLVKMINENYPDKTLEHLALRFLNMPDYAQAMRPYKRGIKLVVGEEVVQLKKGPKIKLIYRVSKDYGNAPKAVLGPYCASDADAGWRLYEKYWPRACKAKWLSLFYMYMKAERVLARNTIEGFLVDVDELERARKQVVEKADKFKAEFLNLIKKSKLWLRGEVRWEGRGYEPKDEDVRRLLFNRLKLRPVMFTVADKEPSTSKKALSKLWKKEGNRRNLLGRKIVDMIVGTEDDEGEKALGLRQYEKLIGTYLIRLREKLLWFEKRVFADRTVWPAGWYFCPGYTVAGARTGRLSSRPNIQNIPSVIRRAFKSRFQKES